MLTGGGVSSCVTAWALTNDPTWKQKYEITLYQQGWRLGGKGASGRNQKYGWRIEEHGMHVWMGFYRNAFKMIQEVYRELNRTKTMPFQKWTDAFEPNTKLWVMDIGRGGWKPWEFDLPIKSGDPSQADVEYDLTNIIETLVALMKKWLKPSQNCKRKNLEENVLCSSFDSLQDIYQMLPSSIEIQQRNSPVYDLKLIKKVLKNFRKKIKHKMLNNLAKNYDIYDELRHLYILCEMTISSIRGILKDKLFQDSDLNKLNSMDIRYWFQKHGISKELVDPPSSVIKFIYDVLFAYENGDANKPNLEAGSGLRTLALLFTAYKGHPLYKMKVRIMTLRCYAVYIVVTNMNRSVG